MSGLSELIERVERLAEPDAYIDAVLATLFIMDDGWVADEQFYAGPYGPPDRHLFRKGDKVLNPDRSDFPFYTASIDAAVDLVESVLPGRGWGLLPRFFNDTPFAGIIASDGQSIDLQTAIVAGGPTPALALCVATLRALAQERSDG